MGESHIHNDKQKKSDTKVFILYDFNTYEAKEQVKLIYGDRHWNNGYLWVRKNNERCMREASQVLEKLCVFFRMMVIQVYDYMNIHPLYT